MINCIFSLAFEKQQVSTMSCTFLQSQLKKRVSFNRVVKVILIPTKDEFRLAGLKTAVWWNAFEIGGRHPEKLLAKRDIACIRQNNRICLAEVGCIQEVAGLTLPSEKASQERAIQANSGKLFQIEVAV